jgi:acetoacetyl-CoA synthetase
MDRVESYASLHQWSVKHAPEFWRAIWDFCGVIGEAGERTAIDLDRMPGARFFPDGRLNFTENLLRQRGSDPAIVATTEDAGSGRCCTTNCARPSRGRRRRSGQPEWAQAIASAPSWRMCRKQSWRPLGAAAIGAVWSSCSPDFGVQGVLDRFGQIQPTVLIAGRRLSLRGQSH